MTSQFRTLLCVMDVLWLQGCAPAGNNGNSVDWNNIDYAKIVCGKGSANDPGCQTKDAGIASVGKGK